MISRALGKAVRVNNAGKSPRLTELTRIGYLGSVPGLPPVRQGPARLPRLTACLGPSGIPHCTECFQVLARLSKKKRLYDRGLLRHRKNPSLKEKGESNSTQTGPPRMYHVRKKRIPPRCTTRSPVNHRSHKREIAGEGRCMQKRKAIDIPRRCQ